MAVAVRTGNLGKLLVEMGDLAGARTVLERALAVREAVLGPGHPKTQSVRGSLEGLDCSQSE